MDSPGFERVLVLDTAGRVGQVGVGSGPAVLDVRRLGEGRRRASDLAQTVDRVLRDRGWKARDLTAVVVGLGPGSYTGLRVGLASAKALAYATGCQFLGVETFAAIALRGPAEVRDVSVVADALKGKLFRRDYRRTAAGGLEPLTPLTVCPAADWLAGLQAGTFVTGPGAGALATRLPPGILIADAERCEPRVHDLLAVARQLPWAVTADMWTAEPLYLRDSSAEEQAAGKS